MADVKMSSLSTDLSVDGTEKLLSLDGTANKNVTVDQIASYTTTQLLASTGQASFVSTDDILVERSDDSHKVPASAMASYVVGAAFDSTVVASASSGDLLVLERAGVAKTISVDNLKDFVQTSTSDVLDFSGLTTATLGATDTLAVCQGSTAKKATLEALETQIWDDLNTHVNGLGAVTATEGSDVLHVYQGGIEKNVTASTMATYFQTQNATSIIATAWDADPVASAVSGDVMVMERAGVLKTIDVNAVGDHAIARLGAKSSVLSVAAGDDFPLYRSGTPYLVDVSYITDYVLDAAWATPVVTTLAVGDELVLGRSGETKNITCANFAAEIQLDILDCSGFDPATLTTADQLLVVQGSTPLKTTLSDIETKLWADRLTHVSGLTAVTTVQDTDILHINQGGDKKVTPVELATYVKGKVESDILGSAWDAAELATPASGDKFILERTGVLATMDIDTIADHAIASLGGSTAATSIAAGDDFAFYRGGIAMLGDIGDMVTYVVGAAFDSAAVASAASGDLLVLERGGTPQTITVDNLKTYMGGLTSLDVSGLNTATLTASDEYLVCQSGAPKKTTLTALETKLWTDFATYAGGLGAAASVIDADKFYMLHGGVPQHVPGSILAAYTNAEMWGNATSAVALNSTDAFLIQQAGVAKSTTLSDVTANILSGAQASVLDVSGLSEATLTTADLIPVCQGTTARHTTVSSLTTEVHNAFANYAGSLSAVATTTAADKLYCLQGGIAKHVTTEELASYTSDYVVSDLKTASLKTDLCRNDTFLIHDSEDSWAAKRVTFGDFVDRTQWKVINPSDYTATPVSTSSIHIGGFAMYDCIAVDTPVRYTYNGMTYYGIISAIDISGLTHIKGPALSTSQPLTELAIGQPYGVRQVDFNVDWYYGDTVQDLLANVASRSFMWQGPAACLVSFSAAHHWPDSGATQPYVNIKIDGDLVSNDNSNKGMQLSGTADTWVANSDVAVVPVAYEVGQGNSIEVRCTQAGTNGDADSLSVSCLFAYK